MVGSTRRRVLWLIVTGFLCPKGQFAHSQILRPGQPEAVGLSSTRLNVLGTVIETAIEAGEIPGAVCLVARKGTVVYRQAFGLRTVEPEPQPMSLDTIFDLASLTKVVATATSLMLLVEEGKLSLTDRVSDYLPDFSLHDKGSLTLLQLATHFSGLRPDVDLNDSWRGYETALELAYQEKLIAPPGEEFIYSDINYFVLGEVVRQVSGTRFDEFTSNRIFDPLGMYDTMFRPGEELRGRIAPTERRDGVLLRGDVHDPTASRMGGVAGHAGLFSTLDDIAIWAQMLLNGGVYAKVRILSPLGVLRMTTPQSPVAVTDWRGIGFDIATRLSTNRGDLFPVGSFGHTGFTGTSVWIDPYSESMVLLFTSRLHPDGKGNVVPLRKKVASVVASSILDLALDRGIYFQRY